jgi:hypothetical protein
MTPSISFPVDVSSIGLSQSAARFQATGEASAARVLAVVAREARQVEHDHDNARGLVDSSLLPFEDQGSMKNTRDSGGLRRLKLAADRFFDRECRGTNRA